MPGLQAYADAFERLSAGIKTPTRRAALDRLLSLGLPTTDDEDWKYTDLAVLHELSPVTDSVGAEPVSALSTEADGLDALNTAFASGGLDLNVPPNADLAEPILAAGPGHRRHRVRIGRNARALLRLETDLEAAFQTVFLDLDLADGANLQVLRVQNAGPESHHLTRVHARLGRDAKLDVSTVDLGGKLSRHDLNIELAEPGAEVSLRGLFVVSGNGHIDNHILVNHRATHGTSRMLVRGLARDSGRGVFNGKIVVHAGAQKTDSEQRIANLILSPKAEINAKPELEIYADDVKCAHGATFGQIDLTALFYLRSRGLPEDEARALLTLAFAMEPLRQIPHAGFRAEVLRLVTTHLGAELDDTVLA
ncbi:MAG: Fe-S cluster assembly protein SufD [Panacagrimonas sp.]